MVGVKFGSGVDEHIDQVRVGLSSGEVRLGPQLC